jgi:hypothetical protein
MTCYCKNCDSEITFDDRYIWEYSGKKIPLDADTLQRATMKHCR